VIGVDLFGGFGGFTLAAEQAGIRIVWAGNHWPLAVEVHAMNHPHAEHACQDLRQADFTKLPALDMVIASPACQPHSTASQPNRTVKHDADRATAWAVIDCAEATAPRAILVENVLSFRRWVLYPAWRSALRALGYHLTELVVTASRHGVPQRRTRLFIAATRKPAVRHLLEFHDAATKHAIEPAFGPCVDWSEGDWRPTSEASPDAQQRFAAAVRNHGPRCFSQHTTGHSGVPVDEPIRTITTKDQWCALDAGRYRALTPREVARAMGMPDSFRLPEGVSRADQVKGLGNAVPPPPARKLIARLADVA
jgi:DNA (cytosine-5)-methyltransferase 1